MIVPMSASLVASMTSSLMKPVAFSLINAITGKGVMRAEEGQEGGFLLLLGSSGKMIKKSKKRI